MTLSHRYDELTARLRSAGDYVWPLGLRIILWWEFWEAGINKLRGENWFADIPWADWQIGFPFPFNLISSDLNWTLATWGELVFSSLLLLGLATRFAAVSLLVITLVAMVSVHWPASYGSLAELWQGYVITAKGAGNFKLPLLFIIMLLPLLFYGGGKLSLDHLLLKMTSRADETRQRIGDMVSLGLALLVIGLLAVYLFPVLGGIALVLGLLLVLAPLVLYQA